jgi:4-amino-4-deoxy-L-arabinose transferase-like glycosyltransferase
MSGISSRSVPFWLALIVAVYLVIGTLFAVYTPAWQAPDEPAHYNYIRYLAEQKRFPVLQPGDYPHDYLRQIVSQGFPPQLSIDPIRYEFHQPPLYYLLAVPLFWLFNGALVPLRLLSVALGGALIYAAYRAALAVVPARPALALGAAAFVAFVPMHVATTAAVNNDTLAELLLTLALWGLVRYARGESERRGLATVGLLLGLGLLTKIYALIGVGVAVAAVILRWWRDPRRAIGDGAWLLVPALAVSLPWLVRNAGVYGWPDLMGLARHDAVVIGQPTTAQWIDDYGWRYVLDQALETTYHSFWGKFGWMAVFMDRRIYLALGLWAGLALGGWVAWVSGARRRLKDDWAGAVPVALLALWVALTLLAYVWYNTKYVQHQGRYLFPALVPIGLALTAGWRRVVGWALGPVGGAGGLLFALPYAGLAVLDAVSLFAFVVPHLR